MAESESLISPARREGASTHQRGEQIMSERGSNNSTLYFVVGALSVAVLVIGYFAMGRGSSVDAGGNTGVAAAGNAEDSGSKFSIEVDKHGGVSGAVEQE